MRLPKWYCVQVISYNESIAIVAYNSTLKDTTSFELTSLQPGTAYNISVIPCNMAGCNESCDVHSVQTESETSIIGGEWINCITLSYIYPTIITLLWLYTYCLASLQLSLNNNTASMHGKDLIPLIYILYLFHLHNHVLSSTNDKW